jgi:hypothetical protein
LQSIKVGDCLQNVAWEDAAWSPSEGYQWHFHGITFPQSVPDASAHHTDQAHVREAGVKQDLISEFLNVFVLQTLRLPSLTVTTAYEDRKKNVFILQNRHVGSSYRKRARDQ